MLGSLIEFKKPDTELRLQKTKALAFEATESVDMESDDSINFSWSSSDDDWTMSKFNL